MPVGWLSSIGLSRGEGRSASLAQVHIVSGIESSHLHSSQREGRRAKKGTYLPFKDTCQKLYTTATFSLWLELSHKATPIFSPVKCSIVIPDAYMPGYKWGSLFQRKQNRTDIRGCLDFSVRVQGHSVPRLKESAFGFNSANDLSA